MDANKAKRVLQEKRTQLRELNERSLSQENIIHALSDEFACIFLVDLLSGHYSTVTVSDPFSELSTAADGENFFQKSAEYLIQRIYPPDREYVLSSLQKDRVLTALDESALYTLSFRLLLQTQPVHYQLKIVKGVTGPDTALVGIRDVNEQVCREAEQRAALEGLRKKSSIYKEAILTNAAGYLEVNLTQDRIVSDIFDYRDRNNPMVLSIPELPQPLSYDAFERWWSENMLLSDRDAFLTFSNCANLISRYQNGERLVEITCRARTNSGVETDCRQTYFLSQEQPSGDVIAICILYDLTEEQKRQRELEALQDELKNSRIKNSVSQMQPHFLYNALGSIREIVLYDPEYASELICDFTTHLRACVRALSNDEIIPFSKELENIRAYVRIEQMRFGEKLRVEYDIGADDFNIVLLSIRPLVENAIRHGIYQRGPAGGTVTIRSRALAQGWYVEVSDTGVGFDTAQMVQAIQSGEKDSTGLQNLTFRLEKMMHADVKIESEIGRGTCIKIHIPKEDLPE